MNRRTLRWLSTLMILSQLLAGPAPLFASARAGEAIDLNKATAAYLYHFFNFTQWPSETVKSGGSFLRLCLVGDDNDNPYIDAINGKLAGEKTVQILRMTTSASFEQCHAIYLIYRSQSVRDEVLEKTGKLAALTVSATPGFVEAGGVVEFVRSDDRLKLKVNATAMHDKGLQISAKLLNLAEVVTP